MDDSFGKISPISTSRGLSFWQQDRNLPIKANHHQADIDMPATTKDDKDKLDVDMRKTRPLRRLKSHVSNRETKTMAGFLNSIGYSPDSKKIGSENAMEKEGKIDALESPNKTETVLREDYSRVQGFLDKKFGLKLKSGTPQGLKSSAVCGVDSNDILKNEILSQKKEKRPIETNNFFKSEISLAKCDLISKTHLKDVSEFNLKLKEKSLNESPLEKMASPRSKLRKMNTLKLVSHRQPSINLDTILSKYQGSPKAEKLNLLSRQTTGITVMTRQNTICTSVLDSLIRPSPEKPLASQDDDRSHITLRSIVNRIKADICLNVDR